MTKSAAMIQTLKLVASCFFISIILFSCKEKKEQLPNLVPLSNYMPLSVGKYIIYRLDSTVATEDAKALVVHRYRVKDSIDAIVTDAAGRPSYRIRRFITDSLGIGPWVDNTTLYVTPVPNAILGERIEVVDNNYRYIKLQAPVRDGLSWPGTSYINTTQSNVMYLNDWQFSYENVGLADKVGSLNFPDAITVVQNPDEGGKEDLSDPATKFDERNYSVEKYAKGVGLIYKEFIHWVFQREPNDASKYYFTENSYGIKLSIISHN